MKIFRDTNYLGIHTEGTLWKLLTDAIKAYRERTEALSKTPIGETSIAQKLDAIIALQEQFGIRLGLLETRAENIHGLIFELTQFNGKVEEFMATQEERLRAVKSKLDAIQTGVDKIQQQLADLKANNPELDDEISAIEATAAAIDTDVNPVAVPPPPVEPPVEG